MSTCTCKELLSFLVKWRDVYRCMFHCFYDHFYAMEQTSCLDLENPVHMFVLHVVYTARINFALNEFTGMFNSRRLSTERNATPNQLWSNGMLDSHNSLACNDIDGPGDVDQFYGEDPEGPSSRGNNNVVVVPDELRDGGEIARYIHRNIFIINTFFRVD